MKFEEIISALRAGKKVKQKHWKDVYLHINSYGLCELSGRNVDHTLMYCKISSLLEADDWEIIDENKIVKLRDLTEEQYDKWLDVNCKGPYAGACEGCPFIRVDCGCNDYSDDYTIWYRNKDLYSDKFLDQEVEIEED